MATQSVRWFFSFDDPYCYVAWPAAWNIAQEYDVAVEFLPVWPVEAPLDEDPQWPKRASYSIQDVRRMAAFYKMPFMATKPVPLEAARRVAMLAEGARHLNDKRDVLVTSAFMAIWGAGEDFSHEEALRAVCTEAEVPWKDAQTWLDDADIRQKLEDNSELLKKLGHYDTATSEFNRE